MCLTMTQMTFSQKLIQQRNALENTSPNKWVKLQLAQVTERLQLVVS